MASSSSNPFVVVEVGEEYPYPSHVCAPNFVTVKLSGRDKYSEWETQILCLLESHGMLSFIYGTLPCPQNSVLGKEKLSDYMLWRRSDALVKGWILGSLSENTLMYVINFLKTNADSTAKDVWDKLHTTYGPALYQQQAELDDKSGKKGRETELVIQGKLVFEDTRSNDESKREEMEKEAEEKKNEAKELANLHQSLYEATLSESFENVLAVLKSKKVRVTDNITTNGNTALHVAVSTSNNIEFISRMLRLVHESTKLLDVTNSDGSTLLHVAAIVGNTEACALLVARNKDLVLAMDNDGDTPLKKALLNMNNETSKLLLSPGIDMSNLLDGTSNDELMVNAISSKDYHSALVLSENYRNLHSDAVLMAIAQNFPHKLNFWESAANKFIRNSECIEIASNKILVILFLSIAIFTVVHYKSEFNFKFHHFWKHYEWHVAVIGTSSIIGFYGLKYFILKTIRILLLKFQFVDKLGQTRDDATRLLKSVCNLIKDTKISSSYHCYYANPVFEATKQNENEVVEQIMYFFPNAIDRINEDGHNIIQYAGINRSELVYNLLYQMNEHKNVYKTIRDPFGNNLLHLAARLAPANKLNSISGAALQIQSELQWFKEVEGFVCPLNIMKKNSFEETPEMVFIREHNALVIEGEKWMKATSESYTITAALITTIVFAAAITVPGGNNQVTGIPIFSKDAAFRIFAISDAISLFASTTSLLMFLSILTTRFAAQDFLYKLPTKLIIGLTSLLISTTSMIIAFGATLFLVFGQSNSWIIIPIVALTCLPIMSFVTLQYPLIKDLMTTTYGHSCCWDIKKLILLKSTS